MEKEKIPFMGISIDNLTIDEIIDSIFEIVKSKNTSQVVGVNVDQYLLTRKNEYSRRIFNEAALVFIDGKPIMLMAKLLGYKIRQRITGPDLMELLCKKGARYGYKIYLLGAAPGVAKKCGEILEAKYPGINVVGSYSPPFGFQKDKNEMVKIVHMLRESKADMLFVGMGSPKQDIFIYENMQDYQIPISFSMGAALDFIAGNVKRAPRWMIECGLEWLYRVWQDPQRLWKRYFVHDMKIVPIFLRELLKTRKKI